MADIFRAYDVRGIYPDDFDEKKAFKIARAVAHLLDLEGKDVVVGRDIRLSSPSLYDAVVDGLTTQGANVVNIGLCTTPMYYFAIAHYKYHAGLMITASHNPKQYNGLKICKENAIPLSGDEGLPDVKVLVERDQFLAAEKKGSIKKRKVADDYAKHALSFGKNIKPLKIAADTANGMVGVILPQVLAQLHADVVPLYFDLDGNFPNHEANPIKAENVVELQKAVVENGCDLGISFDGDGDRVAFIDEKGQRIAPDIAGTLLAEKFLIEKPDSIVYDVRSSWAVKDHVRQLQGKPILSRAGRTVIQDVMRKENAVFGMERSGHYFFRDNYFMDSAVIATITMLTLLSKSNKPLSELVKPLQTYFSSDEINFSVSDREETLQRVEAHFASGKHIHVDGITIEFHDWWFNLRASNTEPVVRLNMEAKTEALLQEKLSEIKKVIENK